MSEETTMVDAPESVEAPEIQEAPEQAQEAPEQASEAQEAPKDAPRKFAVKIDGEEVEVDETELLRGYQLRKASDKRFAEAAEARKQADALISLLREDPAKALSHKSVGVDVRAWAEKFLADQLEEELMSPEEKEKKQKLRRLEELESENERLKNEHQERILAERTQHYQAEYEKGITEALTKSGLPKTNHTVKRMAHYMMQALEHGYELQPVDVADLVKRDYLNDIKDLVGASDAQVLLDLLGDDVAKKIRKYDVAKMKKESSQPIREESDVIVTREPKEKKKMSMEEFDAYLKSIKD